MGITGNLSDISKSAVIKMREKLTGHVAGETDRHSAGDIDYSGVVEGAENVKEALEQTAEVLEEHRTAEVLDHPDGSVTTAKLADSAVTEEKLTNGSVTDEKIGSRTVQNPENEVGTVTGTVTELFNAETEAIRTQWSNTLKELLKKANKSEGVLGDGAFVLGGGAVGGGAVSGNGFAGGFVAKTVNASGNVIDAIQLGTGTNNVEKTLQIYDYQLLDADGNIPAERLANATKESRSVTVTLQASAWSDGVQTMAVSGLAAAGNGIISVSPGATAVQRAAARSAMLSVTEQSEGTLTIAADGTVPEIDIPVVVILLG